MAALTTPGIMLNRIHMIIGLLLGSSLESCVFKLLIPTLPYLGGLYPTVSWRALPYRILEGSTLPYLGGLHPTVSWRALPYRILEGSTPPYLGGLYPTVSWRALPYRILEGSTLPYRDRLPIYCIESVQPCYAIYRLVYC